MNLKEVNWFLVLIPLLLGVLFIIVWEDIQEGMQLKALKGYYTNHNCTLLDIQYYEANDSISIIKCIRLKLIPEKLTSGTSFIN